MWDLNSRFKSPIRVNFHVMTGQPVAFVPVLLTVVVISFATTSVLVVTVVMVALK